MPLNNSSYFVSKESRLHSIYLYIMFFISGFIIVKLILRKKTNPIYIKGVHVYTADLSLSPNH